jgi:hypothetical protein
MLSAFSLAMGLFPPGSGPEITPKEDLALDETQKIQLPPWKNID